MKIIPVIVFILLLLVNIPKIYSQEQEYDSPPVLIGGPDTLKLLTEQEYPPLAKKVGLEGDIIIEIEVDTTGKIINSTWIFGRESFEGAVQKILKKIKYKPAVKNGSPVKARIRQEIYFKLPPYKGY